MLALLTCSTIVSAAPKTPPVTGEWSQSVDSIIFLTVLMLAPFVIMCCTAFPRYIMSLSFLRQSMGLQQIPTNQVLIGVAFFMTLFTMQPTVQDISREKKVILMIK